MVEEDTNRETVIRDHTAVQDPDLDLLLIQAEVPTTEEDTRKVIEETREEAEVQVRAQGQEVQVIEEVHLTQETREEDLPSLDLLQDPNHRQDHLLNQRIRDLQRRNLLIMLMVKLLPLTITRLMLRKSNEPTINSTTINFFHSIISLTFFYFA